MAKGSDKDVEIGINAKDKTKRGLTSAQKNLKKTSKEADGLAKRFRSVARATVVMEGPLGGTAGRLSAIATMLNSTTAGLIAAGVGFTAMTAAMYSSLKRLMEFEQQTFKVDALLKQTGHAAGLTGGQIEQMALGIGRSTLESADGVREASAVLLSFKSVAGDTFGRTMRIAADMSAVTGQDLKSSVIQLGKALEDPMNGMSALRRSGISFTNQQKDMIVEMNKAGKTAEAQAEVLKLLEGQLGGAGVGAGRGLSGAVDLVSENWNLMLQRFGNSGPGKVATTILSSIGEHLDDIAIKMAKLGDGDAFHKKLNQDIDLLNKQISQIEKSGGVSTHLYKKLVEERRVLQDTLESSIEGDKLAAKLAKRKGEIAQAEIKKTADAERKYAQEKKAIAEAEKQREKEISGAKKYGEKLVAENQKFQDSLLEKSHIEDLYLERRLEKIAENEAKGLIDKQEAHNQEQAAYALHNSKITEINRIESEKRAEDFKKSEEEKSRAVASALSNIASMMSSHSKKMFKIGKAASLANALMKTYSAVNTTWEKVGYPWGIPLAAAQLAAGMANVQKIRSQKFSAAREHGGPVIAGRTYKVNERGPELWTAPRTGHIINNTTMNNMGGSKTLNLNVAMTPDSQIENWVKRNKAMLSNLVVEAFNDDGRSFA